MPQHKAVCALLSRVTQPLLTLGAVPRGVHAAFGPGITSGAACPLVLGLLRWIALGDGGGKVAEREGTHSSSTMASSSPAAVIPYQLTGQLELKLFDGAERCIIAVALLENECIRYSNVKQKVKNVFVKFSAFCSATAVPPDLVTSVDTAHKSVLVDDGRGTGNRYPCTILLVPEDSTRLGLTGGGHHCDDLSVHPRTGTYVAFLDCKEVTSIIMCVFTCIKF